MVTLADETLMHVTTVFDVFPVEKGALILGTECAVIVFVELARLSWSGSSPPCSSNNCRLAGIIV